jgi:hypothetical protein
VNLFTKQILGIPSMDQVIIMVKNWLNNLHANCKPNSNLKQYFLPKENYDLIEKHNFFVKLQLSND